MPITGTQPLVINKTYDSYWMNLRTIAPDPNHTAAIEVTLKPYSVDEYGVADVGPSVVRFRIADVFAEAASDPEFASILQSLFAKVQSIAQARHLI